jgi:hypothetical protein
MATRMTTVPLPLSLHLAAYTVIGLFSVFAGGLNLLDPEKYLHALAFFVVAGLSWGYVFGIYMARREVVVVGFALSLAYVGVGAWQCGAHLALGLLLLAMGVYGGGALLYYRRQLLEP